jgi:UDP-N-acetylglucosamine diphosphorylase/glucosamine-1-phosphate N-acetyltransferase
MNDKNFLPLTYLRPAEELISGATKLKDNKRQNIEYPWDLIKNLKADLEEDLGKLGAGIKGEVHPSVAFYNKENILVEKGAEIGAHSTLDARQGPIYIGEGTIVHPGTLLRGPLSIGKHCRIAGELVASILMDYVNKGHYGFLGHSYICSWVNMGAGTTNSNMKNNYGSVKVMLDGKQVDTGETFMGCFIGDHTKTAIGTMIYTGCVIGICSNLFGEPFYKKSVPSFAWGLKGTMKIEDAIEIARAAMNRRKVELSNAEEENIRKVFKQTAS